VGTEFLKNKPNIDNFIEKYILDIIFGVIVPSIITFYLLSPMFIKPGYIFYGDEGWVFFASPTNSLNSIIYSWYNNGPSSTASLFFQLFESFFLLFGSYFANHAFTFFLALLPGVTAYFSIFYTLKLFDGDNLNMRRIGAFIGSIFYLVNWQNVGLIFPMLTWSMSYIIMPVLIYLMFRIFKFHRFYDILLFGAIAALGSAVPIWMLFMPVFLIIYLPFTVMGVPNKIRKISSNILLIIETLAISIIFNSYVIVQAVEGFLLRAGGQYSIYSQTGNFVAALQNLSYYHLIDVLMYGQPNFMSFGLNHQNWTPINALIPLTIILAILVSIFNEKKNTKLAIYFFVITGLALFLSKGVNSPLGSIYKYVVIYSPPGLIGLTREPTSWMQMASISYSFLFAIAGYGLFEYLHKIGIKNLFGKNVKSTKLFITIQSNGRQSKIILKKWGIVRIIFVLISIFILFGAVFASYNTAQISLNSYTYQRFSPTNPPDYYYFLLAELELLHPRGNVMWLPSSSGFSWKNNYLITWGPNLYPESLSSSYIYPYIVQNNTTELGKILALTDTQYLVYQSSGFVGYSPGYVLNFLNSQNDLKLIYHIGGIWLYKNLENISSVYVGSPEYGDSNISPFNFTGKLIAGGDVYTNSSNIYEEFLDLGLINYQKVLYPSKYNNSIQLELKNNESSLVKYGSEPTNYMYNNTVTSLREIYLNNSEYNITINYTIPEFLYNYVLSQYGSAKFWNGFNTFIEVYPYNENPIYGLPYPNPINRVYQIIAPEHIYISNYSGQLVFSMPALSNVSVYLAFYGSGFAQLSPLYYIFSIVNRSVVLNPIQYEFEPLKYRLISGTASTTITPFIFLDNGPDIINGTLYLNESYIYPEKAYVGTDLINISQIENMKHMNIFPVIKSNATYFNKNDSFILNNFKSGSFYNGYRYIVMDSTIGLNASTPIFGNYILALDVYNGTLYLDGTNYNKGNYNIPIYINGTIFISAKANEKTLFSLTIKQINVQTNATISNFYEISPVEYKGYYSSDTNSLVVFSWQYSPLWVIEFNGHAYSPISLDDGLMTGFLLPQGFGHFTVNYRLQGYTELGLVLTGFSYLALIIIGTLNFIERRKLKS